jgi:hypothetical protein
MTVLCDNMDSRRMEAVYSHSRALLFALHSSFGAKSAIYPKAQWAYVRRVDGFQPG